MNVLRPLLIAPVLLALAAPVAAQSLFGTRGLGTPAPPLDARSAALGGIGIGLIGYNTSMLNPAEVAGVTRRGVAAALQPVAARTTVDGEADGTDGARFPLMRVIYPFSNRMVGSVGYGSYLEQSWSVVRQTNQQIGGELVPVNDLLRSTGGIAQVRVGAAYAVSPTLAVGLAAGLLTGSVERDVTRTYPDTLELRPFQERNRWSYLAPIVSAGARWDVAGVARLSAAVMAGGDLDATGQTTSAEDRSYGAPLEVGFGASARLSSLLIATGGAVWSRMPQVPSTCPPTSSAPCLEETVSRETWRVGGGIEYQGVRSAARVYPIRLGVRHTQLPYHLVAESAPTETAFGTGFGFRLGDPNDPAAVADISLERASRSGLAGAAINGGIDERLWRFTFSLSLFGR